MADKRRDHSSQSNDDSIEEGSLPVLSDEEMVTEGDPGSNST